MKNVAEKKKMGRPFLDGKERKSVMLRIRLSESDLSNLDKICEKQGLSRSEVIRNLINKKK